MSLPELAASVLDLWHHFDGTEARRFDREGPPPVLTPFDDDTLGQHTAAFRSLAAAVEDLDVATVDEEIDRTILLDAVRVRLRRLERERPERWNPALWTDRLRAVLAARPGDADAIAGLPEWTERARETIERPPVFHLGLALEDLAAARTALQADFAGAEGEVLVAAEAAIETMDRFLRHETEPDAGPAAGALGPDLVAWRLHHDGKMEMSPNEADRRLSARREGLAKVVEAGGPPVGAPPPDAVLGAGRHRSIVRRRIVAPEWVAGWNAFAAERLGPGGLAAAGEAYLGALIGALDLAVQTGRTPAGSGITELAERIPGRGARLRVLAVRPLEAAVAALLAIQWGESFAARRLPGPEYASRVAAAGLLHPALADWSFDGI